jgi:hypothetical protein
VAAFLPGPPLQTTPIVTLRYAAKTARLITSLGSNLANSFRSQGHDPREAFLVELPHRRAIDHPCFMKHFSRFSLDVCETIKKQRGGGITRILAFTPVVRFFWFEWVFIRRKYPAIPLT